MGRISVPRYLIIIVSLVAGLWLIEQVFQLLYRIADILLIFGLAWLLMLLLDPMIKRLQRSRVPRGVAIAIAYMLTIGGLMAGFVWLVPQATALVQRLPLLAAVAAGRAEEAAFWLQGRGVEIDPNALNNRIIDLSTELARNLAPQAINVGQQLANVLGRIALVLTVSVYMSLTAGRMSSVLRLVIPPRFREEYDTFVRDVNAAYSSYIRGYFYIVALGTLLSAALLYGFRVPTATLWLLAIFLLRLLPFIGSTLANTVLIAIAFATLPLTAAVILAVLLLIGQFALTNVLMPRVMSRELGINPLLVLFAVLLGGKIYGVAGILFSIPAAAIIAAIIERAVNRYLLPLYETGGWWTEQITVVEQRNPRQGGDRRRTPPSDPAPTTPQSSATDPSISSKGMG